MSSVPTPSTFRFSPELHVWLAVQAAKRKTMRSRLIEEILETAVREQTKKP
jgi:predicted HicB family RNase H-like nuclease